jgi:protein TonB
MGTKYNISIFIGLSAVIHVVIIIALQQPVKMPVFYEQGSSTPVIKIDLRKTQESKATTEENKISSTIQRQKPAELKTQSQVVIAQEPRISSVPLIKQKSTPDAEKKQIADSITTTEMNQPQQSQTDHVQVASLLKNELTKYFYYPKLAQRRQWQGQVLLEFTIFPTGIIDYIKIKESSGYIVLDNAAVNALKKIRQKEKFSLALNGNTISQVLPVTYKLIN